MAHFTFLSFCCSTKWDVCLYNVTLAQSVAQLPNAVWTADEGNTSYGEGTCWRFMLQTSGWVASRRLCAWLCRKASAKERGVVWEFDADVHLCRRYRWFSSHVTAAIFVSQNNEIAAIFVSQMNPRQWRPKMFYIGGDNSSNRTIRDVFRHP